MKTCLFVSNTKANNQVLRFAPTHKQYSTAMCYIYQYKNTFFTNNSYIFKLIVII